MSNDITWTAVEHVCRVQEGTFWVSLNQWEDGYEARFRPSGEARSHYERIEPPSDDDGNALDYLTLEAAQAACEKHLEALREKGASHVA